MPLKPEDVSDGKVFRAVRPDGTKAELTFPPDMDRKTRNRLVSALLPHLTDDTTTETITIKPEGDE